MVDNTIARHEGRAAFFEKVDAVLLRPAEFAVMKYSNPDRVLLKIYLDGQAQFAAEICTPDWQARLKEGGVVDLLFHGLFTKDRVVGDISLEEIMHDALPAERSLALFFAPDRRSAYSDSRPSGTNGGAMVFRGRDDGRISLTLTDLSTMDITGTYEMSFTGETRTDSKGREAVVVKLKKVN